jgi:hypothetical protein
MDNNSVVVLGNSANELSSKLDMLLTMMMEQRKDHDKLKKQILFFSNN